MTRTAKFLTGFGLGAALTAAGLIMLANSRTAEAGDAVAGGDARAAASTVALRGNGETITVYRTSTCGCCKAWEQHLRDSGYTVESVELDQTALDGVKSEHGVPMPLRSCHMGVVEGYAIEGHVPAEDLARLLAERPDIRGLAVPGMPPGSPGMDVRGYEDQPFEVFAFTEAGDAEVWATR